MFLSLSLSNQMGGEYDDIDFILLFEVNSSGGGRGVEFFSYVIVLSI